MDTRIVEAKIKKDISRAVKFFMKEHAPSFRSDLKLSVEYPSTFTATIKLEFQYFLSDSSADKLTFRLMEEELEGIKTGALKTEIDDSYFGGNLAVSLIKPGVMLNCDSLMSYIVVKFYYASNFKG